MIKKAIKHLKHLYLWLSTTDNKPKVQDFIKVKDNRKIISFNKKKVYLNTVARVTTTGAEKNYIKLFIYASKDFYYTNMSIDTFIKISATPFVRINKFDAVNYNFVTERLNNTYVFIEGTPFKIGDKYKKSVEEYFSNMEQKEAI